jgi:hypothetical protein
MLEFMPKSLDPQRKSMNSALHTTTVQNVPWIKTVNVVLPTACFGGWGWGCTWWSKGRKFRFPMVSLGFFVDLIHPAALWPWVAVGMADNLTTFTCRLSGILGTSAFCKPQGLSKDCFT